MSYLPPASENDITIVIRPLSAFTKLKVEPVGRWYEILCARRKNRHTFSTHSIKSSSSEDEASEDEEDLIEVDVSYLRSLDPKEWKAQDHYAVLGLKNKRIYATEDDIRRAYRKIVLRHHPDKRRNAGEHIQDLDHDYFTCITKAYEILGNTTKRQSYDSVDPEFDDDIPPVSAFTKENFFEIYGLVFKKNSRWSVKQPVPDLGDRLSNVEDVDNFYKFWYEFDSWREFSYLDEEDKEKGENREERRWIEKQNKLARQKRKKEEMTRIRTLVDNAYSVDPRILKFKEEEKQRKLAQKKAKQEAARMKAEEDERKRQETLEAERKIKEKEEEEAKIQKEKERKEKELIKKQLKKERRNLQQLCEDNSYFTDSENDKLSNLQEVDKLCKLLTLERLQNLNEALHKATKGEKRKVFLTEVEMLNNQLEKENAELAATMHKSASGTGESNSQKPWSHDDLQLLVKAVNLFPAGTNNRWDVVAAFISQHTTSGIKRLAKEVLAKAKDLQKLNTGLKEEVNKKAYEKLEKNHKFGGVALKDESAPSQRFETPAEQQGMNLTAWTAEEQQLLEQALKTYPTSTSDRWDKIADCIPGRSKKDCMKRYKDLVEMVRAKKAAQAAATANKDRK